MHDGCGAAAHSGCMAVLLQPQPSSRHAHALQICQQRRVCLQLQFALYCARIPGRVPLTAGLPCWRAHRRKEAAGFA